MAPGQSLPSVRREPRIDRQLIFISIVLPLTPLSEGPWTASGANID